MVLYPAVIMSSVHVLACGCALNALGHYLPVHCLLVGLLDDLDKELNNYVMRCREWYGWHFPELGKLVTDNLVYAKTVKTIGVKENCANIDLSAILPEEIEAEVKEMAEVSMGTEVPNYKSLE